MRSFFKFVGYTLGALLFAIPHWVGSEFGRVTIDQLIYHLGFGTEGLITADPELLSRFAWRAFAPALAAGVALLASEAFVTHAHRHGLRATLAAIAAWFDTQRQALGDRLAPLFRAGEALFRRRLYLVLPLAGVVYFAHSFAVVDYVRSYFAPDLFSGEYVDPRDVKLTATGKPRSLVLIYVESLETTYSDPKLFGRDLLARLNELKPKGISFDLYREMPGAHFTIAGIVSTQCGIPLRSLAMFGGNDQGEHVSKFLPRARCLGDILDDRGYTNVFLNGSSLSFAGVGKFFRDHHYRKVMGREEWIRLGEKQEAMSGWGLHDDDLFRRAKEELDALVKAKKPFNLTVLTIDTHHPYGHLSRRCAQDGVSDFDGIVECTANQVAEFIEYIVKRGWLDRVAILVQGDHLAMGNTSYEKLISNPQRTVFNLLLGGEKGVAKNTDEVTHFDMLPTILDLIGLRVEGDRAGLGYSAIGTAAVTRPPERMARMQEVLQNYSETYRRLWEPEPATVTAAPPAPAAPAAPAAKGG